LPDFIRLSLDGSKSLSNNNTKQTLYNGEVRQSNNATSDVTNASINLNWNFFDGFKMFATKSKLSYLEKIGKENTRFYIEQTAFDISSAYYQLLNEITLRNFLIEAQEYSRARLELIKLKLQVGNSNNFELQNAQFDFNSDSISIVQQNLKVKQLYLQINRIINQFDDFEFNPTDKIEISTSVDREFIQNQALKNNIQINIEKIKQLVNSQEVEILKGNFYPDLSALQIIHFRTSKIQYLSIKVIALTG